MDQSTINLVHLSDIHFYDFNSVKGEFDLNEDLRNELERDAEKHAKTFNHVDGIIVTGDMAFGGEKEQYTEVTSWLNKLRGLIGSPPPNIWVIPGNHDVHRDTIDDSLHIPQMHQELRSVKRQDIDAKLEQYLSHTDGDVLFSSLENFNTFATPYGCTSSRLRPFWEHDLTLNDGSYLRLLGLNSALISDKLDNEDDNRLVLGQRQSKPYNHDGSAYLVLCHHPVDWLRDQDQVHENLNSRAAIQLFGHKHVLRHRKEQNQLYETLIVSAGAVHPSRTESDWQPRYNFMSIRTLGEKKQRKLEIKLWPRIYSSDNLFVPDRHISNGFEHHDYNVKLPEWDGSRLPVRKSVHGQLINLDIGSTPIQLGSQLNANQDENMENERALVYRFFSLSYPNIIRIAVGLDLLKSEDRGANETDLLNNLYKRAKSEGKLQDLYKLVEDKYSDGHPPASASGKQDNINAY